MQGPNKRQMAYANEDKLKRIYLQSNKLQMCGAGVGEPQGW